jgi:hypothetical protein
MPNRRRCPFCHHWFAPNPRVKQRQKTCAQRQRQCRLELKRRSNQCWRARHPDYFQGFYFHQKQLYGSRADYKRRYRQQHPDYVQRNAAFVAAYRRRHRPPLSSQTEAVSPTSCDLHLTLKGSTTSVHISQVSHTSRDIFVSLCPSLTYLKVSPVSPTSSDGFPGRGDVVWPAGGRSGR